MSKELIRAEIHTVLDDLSGSNAPWDASAVAMLVLDRHRDGIKRGDDGEVIRYCAYSHIREEVRETISKRAGDLGNARVDEQLVLDGYEHLQKYYMLERSGVRLGVSVYTMTELELAAKAAEYRKMGRACYAHADEIDRFRTRQFKVA